MIQLIKELNLKEIRKALNEGDKFKLIYAKSNFPVKHDCILMRMNTQEPKTIADLMREDPNLYGDISNVVTPDKKELLMMLKMLNVALQLEKQGDEIQSTLIQRSYTDPMNLLRDYYNLPILTATHPKLKTSIHKLNDEIVNLGISQDLVEISKTCFPYEAYKKYFYLDLDEECKSLKLVRKKIYTPEIRQSDDDLPF